MVIKSTSFNILLCIFCIIIQSCNQKTGDIGMLIASPVFEPDLAAFSDIITKSGHTVLSANANYDDKQQILQAQELINKGIKVLAIIPVNAITAAAIVRLANDNNVKTIAYERIISNCKLDYFVTFDNVRIGELLAQAALKLKPEGDYFIINGDKFDRNAVWVHEGFLKAIEPARKANKVKVVFDTFIEDWSSDNARFEFERYVKLSGSVPDVVLSAYTGMNHGIFDYIKNENLPVPIIVGQDTETKAAHESINPNQQVALYKSSKVEAETVADIALKIINNEKINVSQKINNGLVEVNSILIQDMNVEIR